MSDPQHTPPPPLPPGYAPRYDPGQQSGPAPNGGPQQPWTQPYGGPGHGQQPGYAPMPGPPAYARYAQPPGQPGAMRPTGLTILLFLVTFGIWGLVYYFQVHEEMKRHSGQGIGGVIALVIAVFLGMVSPFLTSHEVGQLYERRGQRAAVSALTGLWFFPGIFILVGPFIWFVRTNNALNEYWRSVGGTRTTLV